MDKYKKAIIMVVEHPEYVYTLDLSALYPMLMLSNRFPSTEEE